MGNITCCIGCYQYHYIGYTPNFFPPSDSPREFPKEISKNYIINVKLQKKSKRGKLRYKIQIILCFLTHFRLALLSVPRENKKPEVICFQGL